MKSSTTRGPLRKLVSAGVAALALAAFVQSVEPAQALPVVAPQALEAGPAASGVDQVYYRRHGYYRRPFVRRYYGRRVPVPCRGIRTHLSKRYC